MYTHIYETHYFSIKNHTYLYLNVTDNKFTLINRRRISYSENSRSKLIIDFACKLYLCWNSIWSQSALLFSSIHTTKPLTVPLYINHSIRIVWREIASFFSFSNFFHLEEFFFKQNDLNNDITNKVVKMMSRHMWIFGSREYIQDIEFTYFFSIQKFTA